MNARHRAIDYLLWTLALAWPLGVFAQTSLPGVSIFSVLTLLLFALTIPDIVRERKIRVPFELWAPAAVIAGCALVWMWMFPAPRHRDTLEAIALFLLIVQVAPACEAIRRYLFAATIPLAAVTTLSLITPWLGLLPTAFTFRSGASFAFPYTLPEGVHTLLVGVALCLYIIRDRAFSPPQRAWVTSVLVLILILLVGQTIHWARDTHALPIVRYPTFRTGEWVTAAIALWLLARVLAMLSAQRRAAPDKLARFFSIGAVLTVLTIAFVPLHPRAYQGILIGFAAATALPGRLDARGARWPLVASAVLVALTAINFIKVFPVNIYDPRQYDAAAAREMPRIFDRMDWVDHHAPYERRTHLWRARAALELGLPNLASLAFERAAQMPDGPTVLTPPTEMERQQFLVMIRDMVAALPEDRAVCAYERVLLANGERDSSLYSLRLQTSVALTHSPTPDASIFTPVIAMILGDPTIADDMRTWTADEVLTLLSHWGADAAFSSSEEEAPGGVFVLASHRSWDALHVLVRVGDRVMRFDQRLAPITQRDVDELPRVTAMVWAGPANGGAADAQRYTLNVVSASVRPAAYVDVRADGSATFTWADDRPPIDFVPAVRVRLGP